MFFLDVSGLVPLSVFGWLPTVMTQHCLLLKVINFQQMRGISPPPLFPPEAAVCNMQMWREARWGNQSIPSGWIPEQGVNVA